MSEQDAVVRVSCSAMCRYVAGVPGTRAESIRGLHVYLLVLRATYGDVATSLLLTFCSALRLIV